MGDKSNSVDCLLEVRGGCFIFKVRRPIKEGSTTMIDPKTLISTSFLVQQVTPLTTAHIGSACLLSLIASRTSSFHHEHWLLFS
jgi:hypothetical protein